MAKVQLSVRIEKTFASLISRQWLRRAVKLTIANAGIGSEVELGLVIAGDETVHELNRAYRKMDRTTDVISFALTELGAEGESFVPPPDAVMHLGEVIISYPQAKRQAEEHGHSVDKELALLVSHGVLHLLGYDHKLRGQAQKMRAMESRIVADIAAM